MPGCALASCYAYTTWSISRYLGVQNALNLDNVEALQWDYRFRHSAPITGVPFLITAGTRCSADAAHLEMGLVAVSPSHNSSGATVMIGHACIQPHDGAPVISDAGTQRHARRRPHADAPRGAGRAAQVELTYRSAGDDRLQ